MTSRHVHVDIRARLDRIAAEDPGLRAFIRIDREEAVSAAQASAARHVSGAPLSPLDGLATAVKDNLAVRGKAWTAGIEGRRNLIADADATAVVRLRAAGAVLIGGTNMEEAALGAMTDNPTYGRCINPLGPGLTPGGSSGGSAAAVAAGFVDLALGTDTMGSVRVPAAYCGIVGVKPTFGAIDNDGLVMLCPPLDTIGPMSRDVRLLWPAMLALGNADALAAWSRPPDQSDLAGLRIGVPAQLETVDCEASVLAGLRKATDAIRDLGGTVETIDLADWNPHIARRAGLVVIEVAAAEELADLIDRPGAISPHLRKFLDFGRNVPAEKLAAAQAEVARAAASTDDAFANVDAILMPTTAQRAFPHGGPVPANQADLTALANFTGCPAVALPVVLPGEALPASVQLMAPRWSDARLLAWAESLAGKLAGAAYPT